MEIQAVNTRVNKKEQARASENGVMIWNIIFLSGFLLLMFTFIFLTLK